MIFDLIFDVGVVAEFISKMLYGSMLLNGLAPGLIVGCPIGFYGELMTISPSIPLEIT